MALKHKYKRENRYFYSNNKQQQDAHLDNEKMNKNGTRKGRGRPKRAKVIEDEAEEVPQAEAEREEFYNEQELEEVGITIDEDDEVYITPIPPNNRQKTARKRFLDDEPAPTAEPAVPFKAPRVSNALTVRASTAVAKPAVKPKPKPAPVRAAPKPRQDKGKDRVPSTQGDFIWVSGPEDNSIPSIDIEDPTVLNRLFCEKKITQGGARWQFGVYVLSDEDWESAGSPVPREVMPIRLCLPHPHRVPKVPSRFGEGKKDEKEIAKQPYTANINLDPESETSDFDLKLYDFIREFIKREGEMVYLSMTDEEVRTLFELAPTDETSFWRRDMFGDPSFFKSFLSVWGSHNEKIDLRVKFTKGFDGTDSFNIWDMAISSSRKKILPHYMQENEGLAGTFIIGDIWCAKLTDNKTNQEVWNMGQICYGHYMFKFTKSQTDMFCKEVRPASVIDTLRKNSLKEGEKNVGDCAFMKQWTEMCNQTLE